MMNKKEFIEQYYQYEHKRYYEQILEEYKVRYIYNESKVEGNVTPEEQVGISLVYDYIQNFNFEKDYFNIFTTSLIIHQKLFSQCPACEGFGGNLRNATAILTDSGVDVMSADEAKKYFNSFISTSDEIFEPLKYDDILGYIENCIYVTTNLIKAQPFADGNKRTFRSLLNLLLKRITLPPIYISIPERKLYKEYLLEAMRDGYYMDLFDFYYERIEESIIELDLENSEFMKNKEKTKRLLDDIYKIQ